MPVRFPAGKRLHTQIDVQRADCTAGGRKGKRTSETNAGRSVSHSGNVLPACSSLLRECVYWDTKIEGLTKATLIGAVTSGLTLDCATTSLKLLLRNETRGIKYPDLTLVLQPPEGTSQRVLTT